MKGIIEFSHHLLEVSIEKDETVIDATCGNGNDTLFLSKTVGIAGHVLAFDVQEQAIKNTKQLIRDNNLHNITVIFDSHAHASRYLLNEVKGKIGGAIFNLGYLPRSDKAIITEGKSTITAIDTILAFLKKDGLIVIIVYHGHEGGIKEKEIIMKYVTQLDQKKYSVLHYGFINQKNKPPFILAIQKRINF